MFQLNTLKSNFKRIKYPIFLSYAIYLMRKLRFPLKRKELHAKNIQNYAGYSMPIYRYNT